MGKRTVALFSAICVCLVSLMARTVFIGNSLVSDAAMSQHYRTIEIGTSRGIIYDRSMNPLVDDTKRLVAAVTPCRASYDVLCSALGKERADEIIRSSKPCAVEVQSEIDSEYIKTFTVPVRYSESSPAVHLVGALDSSGKEGVSGIEKAYNSFLSENSGSLSVRFEVDASGRVLPGLDKIIVDSNYQSKSGVVLTIDSSVQKIAEEALQGSKIKSGCAVVMHVDSGEILAMASVPTYDRNDMASSLDSDNSPFSNKALSAYSAGSVFKSIVAAFAIESGISPELSYECNGQCRIGDTVFRCYDGKSHGKQTMKEALENSCNTYFINLMEKLDYRKFLDFCKKLGLGSPLSLCDGILSDGGSLPDSSDLKLIGERANLSFGQGRLLLSPVQLLACYHAIATGYYVKPTVLFGFSESRGLVKKEPQQQRTEILSQDTVKKMRKLLESAVNESKASRAKSKHLSLAGKTGTAQSGIYENGKEICRTWFAGFFPAQNPHYIVVVMNENGTSGNSDCAPVFKEICEATVGYTR